MASSFESVAYVTSDALLPLFVIYSFTNFSRSFPNYKLTYFQKLYVDIFNEIYFLMRLRRYLQVGIYPHPSSRDSKERIPFLQSNQSNQHFHFPLFFYKILPTLILSIIWHVSSKFVYSVTETMQEYHLKNPLTSFVNDTYWCIFVDITFLAGIPNLSDEKWEIRRERTKYVSFVATIII